MSHITRDGAIDIVIKSTAQPITKMQTNNDFNEVNSNFNQTGQLIRYDQPSSAQKDHKYSSSSKQQPSVNKGGGSSSHLSHLASGGNLITKQDYFQQTNKRDSVKTDYNNNNEDDIGGFYLDKKPASNMQKSNN
jgi:hypothetical protein